MTDESKKEALLNEQDEEIKNLKKKRNSPFS